MWNCVTSIVPRLECSVWLRATNRVNLTGRAILNFLPEYGRYCAAAATKLPMSICLISLSTEWDEMLLCGKAWALGIEIFRNKMHTWQLEKQQNTNVKYQNLLVRRHRGSGVDKHDCCVGAVQPIKSKKFKVGRVCFLWSRSRETNYILKFSAGHVFSLDIFQTPCATVAIQF